MHGLQWKQLGEWRRERCLIEQLIPHGNDQAVTPALSMLITIHTQSLFEAPILSAVILRPDLPCETLADLIEGPDNIGTNGLSIYRSFLGVESCPFI